MPSGHKRRSRSTRDFIPQRPKETPPIEVRYLPKADVRSWPARTAATWRRSGRGRIRPAGLLRSRLAATARQGKPVALVQPPDLVRVEIPILQLDRHEAGRSSLRLHRTGDRLDQGRESAEGKSLAA